MRTLFLVLASLFFLTGSISLAQVQGHALLTGLGKNAIIDHLKQQYGYVEVRDIDGFGKDVFLAIGDVGFGISRKNIYWYVKEKQDTIWQLVAYQSTNTSRIEIQQDQGGLTVVSKNGRRLFFLASEGLNLDFDAKEQ